MNGSERLGPPPVENLSDVAWARVERGVMSRLEGTVTGAVVARDIIPEERRSASLWQWFAIPAAAVAACGVMYFVMRGNGAPAVSPLAGGEPSRVVAGASPTSVSYGDAHIKLEADSAIVMEPDQGKPTTILEDGAATFAVSPRGDRAPFVVLAGDAKIRVLGTRFRVERHGERSLVSVDEGTVGIQFHGGDVKVGANQRWSSAAPAEIVTSDALIDPVDFDAIDLDPVTTRTRAVHKKRVAAAPAAPAAGTYEAFQKLEAKQPAKAMKGYLQLSQGNGPQAEVALFAAARLATDRKDPRASTLLTIYLRRFPSGASVDDAQALLTRLKGD